MNMSRTSHHRLRVYFAGIDGSGKSSCLDGLIARLSPPIRILRIGTSGLTLLGNGEAQHLTDSDRMKALRKKVLGTAFHGLWLIYSFTYKLVASKYYSRTLDYEVAMLETDMLVNPSAYLSLHFPTLCRILSPASRFRLLHTFFGSRRDTVILHLDVDPAVGEARCRAREEATGHELEPHENITDLTLLRNQLAEITQAARDKGYHLIVIDTNKLTTEQVVDAAEIAIRHRMAYSAGSR
jgi:thymidylate kinase